MKIAIFTSTPLTTNYGGILQNYALQTILKQKGHDVTTLDHQRHFRKANNTIRTILRIGNLMYNKYIETKIRTLKTRKFLNLISQKKIYIDQIKENEFDVYIVGSDQVWRKEAYLDPDLALIGFLGFTKNWNVKRIAYAASFGVSDWRFSEEQTKECSSLIQMFDAISVREDDGVNLCKKYLNIEAKQVLDPTLLLEKDEYIKLAKVKKHGSKIKNKLITYILDYTPDKIEFINEIASINGYTVHNTNSLTDDKKAPLYKRIQPSVEDWLSAFIDAEMIITDSFHGTVFSIIFNKEFLVIGNNERGMSRFNSLLRCFNLEDRLIKIDKYDKKNIKPIDWSIVNEKKRKLQNEAISFLYRNL